MDASGTIKSTFLNAGDNSGEQLVVDWYATYNVSNMTTAVTISAYIVQTTNAHPNRAYAISGYADTNYIRFNGSNVYTASEGGTGSKSNPYRAYTNIGAYSHDDTSYIRNWSAGAGYVHTYATLIGSATYIIPLNEDGYSTFTITSRLTTAVNGYMSISESAGTVTTPSIELYTKVPYKTNGSWDGSNGYIWYKDSNSGWIRKYLYRKENGSWQRK